MENIDQKIDELFGVIKKQREEVEKTEKKSKKSWITTCSFKMPGFETVNLTVAQTEAVKQVVANLLLYKEYQQKACDELGLEMNNEYLGFKYEDWLEDCKKRIAMIELKSKKDKLELLEKRLNGIVSPEQKRQKELDAIIAGLNG